MAVYIASNKSLGDNVYKIGYSINVDERLKQLSNTSVPSPFEKVIELKGNRDLERELHEYYEEVRVSDNREFFYLDEDDIERILIEYQHNVLFINERWKSFYDSNIGTDFTSCLDLSDAEIVKIWFTNGDLELFSHNRYEVVFKENAIWVYDGGIRGNSLKMYPMRNIEKVDIDYYMESAYDITGNGVRVQLPKDLDTTRMVNIYGD